MLTEAELRREAAHTGFRAEVLEKVIRLLDLLGTLRSHPFLGPRVALKGGTALNLFILEVPRLSVDIDLNYIGAIDRKTMLADRPKIEQAIGAVCGRLGLQVKRMPPDHAGGKLRLSYTAIGGLPGTLELDINYMLRTPLWPPAAIDSRPVGDFAVTGVPVLDAHELVAGKLAALLSRNASRDLFDARELLRRGDLDRTRLRLGFVVYGGINRRDWRQASRDDVNIDPGEVDRLLIPMLRGDLAPARDRVEEWSAKLVSECKDLLSIVLPLEPNEREFLDRLNGRGEVVPEFLTDDPALQDRIRTHPGLRWKSLNVRKHIGSVGGDTT